MTQEINFLAQNKVKLEARNKSDRHSFLFIGSLSGTAVLFFLVLVGISIYYQQQLKTLASQKASIETQLTATNAVEKDYLTFYSKLAKVSELIRQRTPGVAAVRDAYTHFTTLNTALTSTNYDYYTKTMDLTLVSNSVFALPQLFELIQDSDYRSQYADVQILTLSRSSNGTYTLKVKVEL